MLFMTDHKCFFDKENKTVYQILVTRNENSWHSTEVKTADSSTVEVLGNKALLTELTRKYSVRTQWFLGDSP